jgi:hypothetical protein
MRVKSISQMPDANLKRPLGKDAFVQPRQSTLFGKRMLDPRILALTRMPNVGCPAQRVLCNLLTGQRVRVKKEKATDQVARYLCN